MNWYGNGNGYGMMDSPGYAIFGMIFMVILFILAVWIIVRIVERGSHNHPHIGNLKHSESGPAALEVLDMRLAKGEISADEYLALKKHLS